MSDWPCVRRDGLEKGCHANSGGQCMSTLNCNGEWMHTIRTDNTQTLANAVARIEELEQKMFELHIDYNYEIREAQRVIEHLNGGKLKLESQRDQLLSRIEELEQEVRDRERDYVILSQDKNEIIQKLQSQRDRLLVALKGMMDTACGNDCFCPERALIREIEGG